MSEVPLYDIRHILGRYAGVPDIVWINEDDRPFMMAAGAGIADYDGR